MEDSGGNLRQMWEDSGRVGSCPGRSVLARDLPRERVVDEGGEGFATCPWRGVW